MVPMQSYDDFDPDGQQQDGSRAIIALLVIMGLVLLWGTVIAPMISPPAPAAKAPGAKATTADAAAKEGERPKPTQLTTGAPTTATTATKGQPEPARPQTQPETPAAKTAPTAPPAVLTRASALLSATFTNQDARLARLVMLDHFRTPVAKHQAARARRKSPDADVAPYGLPILGQEQATLLDNGDLESGEDAIPGQGPPTLPRKWRPSPQDELGKALLWSYDARSGKRSLAIKDPAKGVEWQQLVRVIEPGDTVEFAAYVKVDAAGGGTLPTLKLIQNDGNGKQVSRRDEQGKEVPVHVELALQPAQGWQRLAAQFITEEPTRQCLVVLQAPEGFKGQVCLDDVSLVRCGEPSFVLLPPKRQGSEAPTPEELSFFKPQRFQVAEEKDSHRVSFRTVVPGTKLEITKTFILPSPSDPGQRHVLLDIQFRNLGDKELKLPGYLLRGPGGLPADPSPAAWKHGETLPNAMERGAAAALLSVAVARVATGGQVNVPTKSFAEVKSLEAGGDKEKATTFDEVGGVLWSAVASSYFAAILDPRPDESQRMKVESGGARMAGDTGLCAVVQVAPFSLEPSGKNEDRVVHRYRLFAGPKTADVLASYRANYERLIASRWLDPLTAACSWVLRAAHAVIPNYGIAIILLTIVVRTVLHPLSKKSQTSMQKMQKLQPQMAELREKYKTDKKRQQEEMMKLYKTYGVNPMGGCLPIVLQIPIFIGLWRALQESIELRQAPFMLWIQDLSQADALFGVVNVLPITSCVLMFIQTKLQPKTGDPKQQQTQKMMGYIMPVFLGYILYGLPSGLALYFIASTVIGLGEQRIIKRHMDRMGDLKPVVEKPSKQTRKALLSRGAKRPKKKLF